MSSSKQPSKPLAPQGNTKGDFTQAIKNNALYKERSHNTHHKVHVPELQSRLKALQEGQSSEDATPRVILLGSSNLERFKTTGKFSTHVLLLGDSMLERLKRTVPTSALNTRPDTVNLGVGGDKIQHVLYRVSLGLFDLVQSFPIKLWVIHVGSNNLRPGQGPLRPDEINKLWLLLRAIFSKASDSTKVLLCGIFERRDMQDGQVRESNERLLEMVHKMNAKEGRERIFWEGMPDTIDLTKHLADQAHLNRTGYGIWDKVLSARIEELLKE